MTPEQPHPSSGVRPMLVSTLSPPRMHATLAPAPRWHATRLVSLSSLLSTCTHQCGTVSARCQRSLLHPSCLNAGMEPTPAATTATFAVQVLAGSPFDSQNPACVLCTATYRSCRQNRVIPTVPDFRLPEQLSASKTCTMFRARRSAAACAPGPAPWAGHRYMRSQASSGGRLYRTPLPAPAAYGLSR